MEVKPGYKQTEVGIIPVEWDAITLQQIVENNRLPSGIYKAKSLYGRGKRIIKVGDVFGYDYFVPHLAQRVVLSDEEISKYRVRVGDIIIALASVKLEGVGKVLLVESLNEDTAYDHNVAMIRLIPKVDPRYLFHVFKSGLVRKQVASRATQVGTTFLKASTVLEFSLPLPATKSEQEAIANSLSEVDELLGGLDRLIAKKSHLKQAGMQQLLTGQTRLPGFSGKWITRPLGELLIRLCNGAVYKPGSSYGAAVTRIETISEGIIDLNRTGWAERTPHLAAYQVLKGDILLSHINSLDHIGKVAIYTDDTLLYHGMNLLLLRCSPSVNSKFLFYWLSSGTGRKKTAALAKQAVSQASINTGDLRRIELTIPSLSEQNSIAEVLTDMDVEIEVLCRRREKTLAMKQAMMQELLTGKTRLI